MWTTLNRMRIGLASLTLALAVTVGAWGGGPQPAAAAGFNAIASYANTSVTITGTNIVRSWTGTTHTIRIRNNNSYALPAVRVVIAHSNLPIDFHSIQDVNGLGFSCVVLDGVALGGARAECSGNRLAAGQELKIKLTGGTTIVTGRWTDWLTVSHYPNYPGENSSLVSGYQVAVNPS